ncbi:MAG: FAD-dependent oxidoreductase [Marinobacter sp.]
MKKWLCVVCGLIYDEAKGWPADGIPPGTRWEDVPDDWQCPDCLVGKSDFQMIELPQSAKTEAPAQNIKPKEAPIVIIGTGYAGYGLAEALRQRDLNVPIVMFTADDGHQYSKPGLSTALARDKLAEALVSETPLELEARLNIRVYSHCRVSAIDPKNKTVSTAVGKQVYSKIVLALGAAPVRLPLAGDGAGDVVSVNDLQDYRFFREQLQGAKRVSIIGNGLIGCEFANDLINAGIVVDVIGLSPWPMDRLIPREIGDHLQDRLRNRGVGWHFNTTVSSVKKRGKGYVLALENGTELETDLVLSAVGLKARTELAAAAGAEINLGVKINAGLRTNLPDVFAIGDCAEINGQLLPYLAPINAGIPALADGLLGRPTMAQYPLMPVIVKTPACPVTVQPPPPNLDGDWRIEHTQTGLRAIFIDRHRQVKGFALTDELASERQHWLDRIGSPLEQVA